MAARHVFPWELAPPGFLTCRSPYGFPHSSATQLGGHFLIFQGFDPQGMSPAFLPEPILPKMLGLLGFLQYLAPVFFSQFAGLPVSLFMFSKLFIGKVAVLASADLNF